MAIKIVALPDGSWDTVGDIVTLTEEQYEKLAAGEVLLRDLLEDGIEVEEVNTNQ